MNNIKLKFNVRNIEALRHEPAVKADLLKRAERIAETASRGGQVAGYIVTELNAEKPRSAVSIMATGHALMDQRKNLSLLKAIQAGKG